jgi:tetratricopeptide (TPR) repeat protein
MSEQFQETQERPLFAANTFVSIVALIFAVLAVVTSVIASLESDAGLRVSQTATLAQKELIEATRVQTVGEMEAGYAWTQVYRLWLEWDTRAYNSGLYENTDEQERAQVVRDRLQTLSPLMGTEYYPDPSDFSTSPQIERFEADTFIRELTFKTEKFKNYNHLTSAWDEKADNYTNYLAWLTLALILLGFSVTLITDVRLRVMILFASFIIIVWSISSTIDNYRQEILVLPDEAMAHYAEGRALASQYLFAEAAVEYTKAIELADHYEDAYVARAIAYRFDYRDNGNAEGEDKLGLAIVDYEKAVTEFGKREVDTVAGLAEIYYLQGRFADAIRVSQLGAESGDWINLFDKGRSTLASGDIAGSVAIYDEALNAATAEYNGFIAAGQQPAVDFWRNLDIALLELDYLAVCFTDDYCDEAPPKETMTPSPELTAAIIAQSSEIKTLSMSLELFGALQTVVDAKFDGILVFSPTAENPDEPVDYLDSGSQTITLKSNFEGMKDGQVFSVRVYLDDLQYPTLRYVEEWTRGETGVFELPMNIGEDYGFYTIQFFVDGQLVAEGGFGL